uniref:Uncharacterized protein n=1 Tax=Anopheles coluzzii TaxID=1518534 RepID=A0A8W7P152_ANOCL
MIEIIPQQHYTLPFYTKLILLLQRFHLQVHLPGRLQRDRILRKHQRYRCPRARPHPKIGQHRRQTDARLQHPQPLADANSRPLPERQKCTKVSLCYPVRRKAIRIEAVWVGIVALVALDRVHRQMDSHFRRQYHITARYACSFRASSYRQKVTLEEDVSYPARKNPNACAISSSIERALPLEAARSCSIMSIRSFRLGVAAAVSLLSRIATVRRIIPPEQMAQRRVETEQAAHNLRVARLIEHQLTRPTERTVRLVKAVTLNPERTSANVIDHHARTAILHIQLRLTIDFRPEKVGKVVGHLPQDGKHRPDPSGRKGGRQFRPDALPLGTLKAEQMAGQDIDTLVMVHTVIGKVGKVFDQHRLDQVQIGDHQGGLQHDRQAAESFPPVHLAVQLVRHVRDGLPAQPLKVPQQKVARYGRYIASGPVVAPSPYPKHQQTHHTDAQIQRDR